MVESRRKCNESVWPPRPAVVAEPSEYRQHSRAPTVDVLRAGRHVVRSHGRDTKEAWVVHPDAHIASFRFGPNDFAQASLIGVVQALRDNHGFALRVSKRTEDPASPGQR